MRRVFLLAIFGAVLLLAQASVHGKAVDPGERYHPVDAKYPFHHVGGVPGLGEAKVDTVYLLGGPGSLSGRFEDAVSNPDPQGWIAVDRTTNVNPYWHVDTYNCQNLDPYQPTNHAWWCGRFFLHDCGTGDYAGYGPDWKEQLDFSASVGSPADSVTVTIEAVLNHDLEIGYDYLYLQAETSAGMVNLRTFNGTAQGVSVSETLILYATDYVGAGADEVHLRWLVITDEGYDDADCDDPSQGAAQIDSIAVYFDQGSGPILQGSVEDCDTNPVQWAPAVPPGVGNFAQLWPRLAELDPCNENVTPQWVFIDDGVVVPGTGGYACNSWCYGPGGWVVNPVGGLIGPSEHIRNEIWSPALVWPTVPPGLNGGVLEFDVYPHLPIDPPTSAGVFYIWGVRSTSSSELADLDLAVWRDRNFVYYGETDYRRDSYDVTDLLVPGRTYVQLSLGVYELGWIWGFVGTDPTPAPYMDNVLFKAYDLPGPALSANEVDLAQDNFPAIGAIDYVVLSANSVRFDSANLGGLPPPPIDQVGDWLVASASAIQPGSSLTGPPTLNWHMKVNPLFGARPTTGSTTGYPLGGDRYGFDLPDTGFFFPGDVIHYYFRATDNLGGVSILPADTTDFNRYATLSRYPSSFTCRALPTMLAAVEGEQPDILLWNDYGTLGGEDEWMTAMANLSLNVGEHFDLYTTNAPLDGQANGLSGRATLAQIAHYETILYTSGDASQYTLSDGGFTQALDPSDDVTLLTNWLSMDDKNLLLTGSNLACECASVPGSPADIFLATWPSVSLVSCDVSVTVGQNAPRVQPVPMPPGNPVFFQADRWTANGSCRDMSRIDEVNPIGGATRIAEFLDVNNLPGLFPLISAATLNVVPAYTAEIISIPYDFMYVYDPMKAPPVSAERTRLLEDILIYFGHAVGGAAAGVPNLILSMAETAAIDTVSVFTLPNGAGYGLDHAYGFGGAFADATITVTLIDAFGIPVANYPQEDVWLESEFGGLVLCEGGSTADANTDNAGITTFSRPLYAGGFTDPTVAEGLQIMIAGSPLAIAPLTNIWFNSADNNGDLVVNLSDLVYFAGDLIGPYNYRSDLYWDGVINLSDFVLWVEAFLQDQCTCP